MITEDYVSFETAKLLKEKGFDCCCNVWYSEYTSPYGAGKYISIEFDNHNKFNENYKFICFAPTIQMAMKWLREVHNIDISVTPDRKAGYSVLIFKDKRLPFDTLDSYSIYEEACEAAIKYCLENLI